MGVLRVLFEGFQRFERFMVLMVPAVPGFARVDASRSSNDLDRERIDALSP